MSVPRDRITEIEFKGKTGQEWVDHFCQFWDLIGPSVVGRVGRTPNGFYLYEPKRITGEALYYPVIGRDGTKELAENGFFIGRTTDNLRTRGIEIGDLILCGVVSTDPKSAVKSLLNSLCVSLDGVQRITRIQLQSGATELLCDTDGNVLAGPDEKKTIRLEIAWLEGETKIEKQLLIDEGKKLEKAMSGTADAKQDLVDMRAQLKRFEAEQERYDETLRRLQYLGLLEEDSSSSTRVWRAPLYEKLPNDNKTSEIFWNELLLDIQAWIYQNRDKIYFPQYLLADFLTLIRTGDFFILSGAPGCGKSQMVRCFAAAIGAESKIIPVLPNWNSKDDLLGYYNPMQDSFVSAPFLEALVEAEKRPDQLYLICLDEMNLARVENYFAYFLSLLEDRSRSEKVEVLPGSERALIQKELERYGLLSGPPHNETAISEEALAGMSEEQRERLRRKWDSWQYVKTRSFPKNVRVVGTVNFDESTQHFSPKLLDRAHVLRFPDPLASILSETERESLKNRFVQSEFFVPFDNLNCSHGEYQDMAEASTTMQKLWTLSDKFFRNIGAPLSARSYRQALHYARYLTELGLPYDEQTALNQIVLHKIIPRLQFDWNDDKKEVKEKIIDSLVKETGESLSHYARPHVDFAGPSATLRLTQLKDVARASGLFNGME